MKVRTKSLDVVELPILLLWWLLLTLFRLRILSALGLDSRVVTARNICVEAYTNLVMCLRRMLLLTIYSRRRGRRRLLASGTTRTDSGAGHILSPPSFWRCSS